MPRSNLCRPLPQHLTERDLPLAPPKRPRTQASAPHPMRTWPPHRELQLLTRPLPNHHKEETTPTLRRSPQPPSRHTPSPPTLHHATYSSGLQVSSASAISCCGSVTKTHPSSSWIVYGPSSTYGSFFLCWWNGSGNSAKWWTLVRLSVPLRRASRNHEQAALFGPLRVKDLSLRSVAACPFYF